MTNPGKKKETPSFHCRKRKRVSFVVLLQKKSESRLFPLCPKREQRSLLSNLSPSSLIYLFFQSQFRSRLWGTLIFSLFSLSPYSFSFLCPFEREILPQKEPE